MLRVFVLPSLFIRLKKSNGANSFEVSYIVIRSGSLRSATRARGE